MVKLRKGHTKLKLALIAVLGFIIGLGGTVGIWWGYSYIQGLKGTPDVSVENKQNYKLATPEGKSYSDLLAEGPVSGLDTVGYLAWTLGQQSEYHSQSQTTSTAVIATQTTNSYKDYKDGIMVSSDFTYGFTAAGTQACFVPQGNEEGKGAGVYMRHETDSPDSSTTGTSAQWGEEILYYDRDAYLTTYGEYSTEMTVYLLNEETITGWEPATDNGDGTFTQVVELDAPKATYYYRYAMMTRGGLDRLPEFDEITLTITFDDDYRVLEIFADEHSQLTYIFSMSSVSKTTTTYSYGEETFDREHYALYESCYKPVVGTLESVNGGDGGEEEADVITVLMSAFEGMLNGNGQQFDIALDLGGRRYAGRLFLCIDLNNLANDVLGSVEARLALSADENIDGQDLYIQLKEGEVSAYYSSDFALTADIGTFGDIIDKFSAWADSLNGQSAGVVAMAGDGTENILEQLLAGLAMEETQQGAKITLSLDDLAGFALDAEINFSGDGDRFTLIDATIGGLAYNGQEIPVTLGLTPSSADIISHEEAETPFDVNAAADSLFELLSSEQIRAELTLEGEKLSDLLYELGAADLGDGLDGLRLEAEGGLDISGLTVQAAVRLINGEGNALLDADVYYIYGDETGEYGRAYLHLKNVLGASLNIKVYSDIAELADTVQALISGAGGAEAQTYAGLGGLDTGALISGILSLDFGSVIKEVTANGSVIGATLNADGVLAMLGIDLSLGDISLEYAPGEDGGRLTGSMPALGLEAGIFGSGEPIPSAPEGYLEAHRAIELVQSAAAIFDGATAVNFDIGGAQLNINGVSLDLGGKGTVGWTDGGVVDYVALDLTLDAAAGGAEDSSPTELKLTYSAAANGGYEIKIALNGAYAAEKSVLVITQADIEDLKAQVNAIAELVDKFTAQGAGETVVAMAEAAGFEAAAAGEGDSSLTADLLKAIFGGDGILSVLNIFGEPVITIGQIEDAIVLNLLGIDFAVEENAIAFDGELRINGSTLLGFEDVSVGAGRGAAPGFAGYSEKRLTEDNTLIGLALDYIFNAFDSIDVGSFLGGKTYSTELEIDGAKSGIAELAGVYVDASLYFTDGITYSDGTAQKENGKLVELVIDELTVGDFTMQASVVYMNGRIHLSIDRVNDIQLSEMDVSMDASDISKAVDNILALLENPALMQIIEGVLPAQATDAAYTDTLSEGESGTLADILGMLLSFDFKQIVSVSDSAIILNIDNLLDMFGMETTVGSAAISADGDGGITITASSAEGEGWLSLVAQRTEKRGYDSGDYKDFVDVGFVADLLGDLDRFAASNYAPEGEVNTLYTFTQGRLSVNLSVSIISATINIDNVKLTAGIDENGEIVATLEGHLNGSTLTTEGDIGFTYYNGYITLKRGNDYRVMTPAYLIDNLLKGDAPVITWFLGINDWLWDKVVSGMLPELSSGVSDPDELYLYEQRESTAAEGINVFDYIRALLIKDENGNITSDHNAENADNINAILGNVGLNADSVNYYMCSLDAAKLLGDMGTTLDLAILRSAETGIAGLNAYAALALTDDINLTVKLDMDYRPSDGDDATVNDAPVANFFAAANATVEGGINFGYYNDNQGDVGEGATRVFGEYVTGTGEYRYTDVLSPDYAAVEIYDFDGTPIGDVQPVKKGSTIYLYDFSDPAYVEFEGERYAYIYVPVNSPDEEVVYDPNTEYAEQITIDEGKTYRFRRLRTDKYVVTLSLCTSEGEKITDYNLLSGDPLPSDVRYGTKILLGNIWYTDPSCTQVYAPEGGACEDIVLYGRFIEESKNEGGVIYTFVNGNDLQEAHYAVTGYTYAVFGSDTLVLNSIVDGLPVTEISSGALAMTKDENGNFNYSLRNVIVPASITKVYGRAFLDNKDLANIVFLAPEVEFNNNMDYYKNDKIDADSSYKNYPFYGCWNDNDSSAAQKSDLHIWFNRAVNANGETVDVTQEKVFCVHASSERSWERIGDPGYGGEYGGGEWAYVSSGITVTEQIEGLGNDELLGYANGRLETAFGGSLVLSAGGNMLVTVSGTPDGAAIGSGLATLLTEQINAHTADVSGFINGYTVTADVTISGCGVAVNITVQPSAARWYPLSVEYLVTRDGETSANANAGRYAVDPESTCTFGGTTYVMAGAQITFSSNDEQMYLLTGVTLNGGSEQATLTMPQTAADVKVYFNKLEIPAITVNSAFDFTLGSVPYGNGGAEVVIGENTALNDFGTPSAEGYTFLGWAKQSDDLSDGTLEFVSGATEIADGDSYYIIWAVSGSSTLPEGFTVTQGTDLPQGLTSATGAQLYGWYTSSDWTARLSAIDEDNTVVYARWAYYLTVTVSKASVTGVTDGYYPEGQQITFIANTDEDKLTVEVKYTSTGEIISAPEYRFEMPSANVTISATGNCIAAGTLITLADGSQKPVEELTGDELLLVWNLETGTFDSAPIVFVDSEAETEYEIVNLMFSDGTTVKVISEHGFWDYDLNEYVYLDRYAADYIGHWFAKQTVDESGNPVNVKVRLDDVVITREVTTAWSPVTFGHLCYYVNGMLSMPGGIDGLFNIFEVDPDTMMYDKEAMAADIEKYGLFTCEDFGGLVSEEVFEAFNGKYLKVAIGKGMLTWDEVVQLVERYSKFF